MSAEEKLTILKEVRQKSVILERSKQDLIKNLSSVTAEDKCLNDCMAELVQMEKEKMARMEELRQLDNDLACMQIIVDQASQSRNEAFSGACSSYGQFSTVKKHVDILRSEGLGLEMSQGLEEEVMEVIDRLGVGSEHDSSQENRETVLSKCTICNQNKNNTRCNFCNDKGK